MAQGNGEREANTEPARHSGNANSSHSIKNSGCVRIFVILSWGDTLKNFLAYVEEYVFENEKPLKYPARLKIFSQEPENTFSKMKI